MSQTFTNSYTIVSMWFLRLPGGIGQLTYAAWAAMDESHLQPIAKDFNCRVFNGRGIGNDGGRDCRRKHQEQHQKKSGYPTFLIVIVIGLRFPLIRLAISLDCSCDMP